VDACIAHWGRSSGREVTGSGQVIICDRATWTRTFLASWTTAVRDAVFAAWTVGTATIAAADTAWWHAAVEAVYLAILAAEISLVEDAWVGVWTGNGEI